MDGVLFSLLSLVAFSLRCFFLGGGLSSAAINNSALSSLREVVECNSDLLGKESKMGTMAVTLAREVYLGEEVMGRCTANGYGDKPGLPIQELKALEQDIRNLYPQYLNSALAFEEKWGKCREAISQACKRARKKQGNSEHCLL